MQMEMENNQQKEQKEYMLKQKIVKEEKLSENQQTLVDNKDLNTDTNNEINNEILNDSFLCDNETCKQQDTEDKENSEINAGVEYYAKQAKAYMDDMKKIRKAKEQEILTKIQNGDLSIDLKTAFETDFSNELAILDSIRKDAKDYIVKNAEQQEQEKLDREKAIELEKKLTSQKQEQKNDTKLEQDLLEKKQKRDSENFEQQDENIYKQPKCNSSFYSKTKKLNKKHGKFTDKTIQQTREEENCYKSMHENMKKSMQQAGQNMKKSMQQANENMKKSMQQARQNVKKSMQQANENMKKSMQQARQNMKTAKSLGMAILDSVVSTLFVTLLFSSISAAGLLTFCLTTSFNLLPYILSGIFVADFGTLFVTSLFIYFMGKEYFL